MRRAARAAGGGGAAPARSSSRRSMQLLVLVVVVLLLLVPLLARAAAAFVPPPSLARYPSQQHRPCPCPWRPHGCSSSRRRPSTLPPAAAAAASQQQPHEEEGGGGGGGRGMRGNATATTAAAGDAAGAGEGGGVHRRRHRAALAGGGDGSDLRFGDVARMDLMGWDVLEPEEEGYTQLGLTVPDVKPEDFRDLKVRLRFGFEGGVSPPASLSPISSSRSSSSRLQPREEEEDEDSGRPTRRRRRRRRISSSSSGSDAQPKPKQQKQRPVMVEFMTPYALCFPPGSRARGCQELITASSLENSVGGGAAGLPCTAPGGACPFVTFTCSRGHTWKAQPGTPACFYCPRCREATRNVRGSLAPGAAGGSGGSSGTTGSGTGGTGGTLPLLRKRLLLGGRRRTLDPAARFRDTVGAKGGKVLGAYMGAKVKTRLRCARGHEWEAVPDNILRGRAWCPLCAKADRAGKRTLTLEDMQSLAAEAGGPGARCLSDEYRGSATPLLWSCGGESGATHLFSRSPNYIKKGLAVGRTFCVECAKLLQGKGGGEAAQASSSSTTTTSSSSSSSQKDGSGRRRPRKEDEGDDDGEDSGGGRRRR